VDEVTKALVNKLKAHYKYKNVDDLVLDMSNYFLLSGISPRSQENSDKKIAAFREAIFKLLRSYERDYFKPHYEDFNLVSGYIKEEFTSTKNMIGSQTAPSNKVEKIGEQNEDFTSFKIAQETRLKAEEKKRKAALEYVLNSFIKKVEKQGQKLIVTDSQYLSLKSSLENIIEVRK